MSSASTSSRRVAGSNPKDKEFFARANEIPWRNAQLAAFGATRRPNRSADGDPDLETLLVANTPIVTLVGKAWTLHVDEALRTTREENLAMIADSAQFFVREGRRAVFDAEHFFDGYAADRSYALECLAAAADAGADTLALCDTNGGTLPDEIVRIVRDVLGRFPGLRVGVHCPTTQRVRWRSLVAVGEGVTHVRVRPTGTASGAATRTCSR
jgi:2-isopropylmalate synthase